MESGRKSFLLRLTALGNGLEKSGNVDVVAQDENGRTLAAYCNWEKNP